MPPMLQDKLLDAAVEHFGQRGFDGASTREIARASGTAMSSITYHFGGKEGLYLAAAEHVAAQLREHQGPLIEAMRAARGDDEVLTRDTAIACLLAMLDGFLALMLDPASANWCGFIVREQQQPSAAFEVLYQGAMRHMNETALTLLAAARPDLPDMQRRALLVMFFGQALVVRIARASVCRILGVEDLGDEQALLLRDQLRTRAAKVLRGETS